MGSRTVGLSGGIGSGKSTVGRMFCDLGATLIDSDAIARELQAPGTPLLAEIAEAFGATILRADGSLDRDALGALVFGDSEARKRLNDLVHPCLAEEMFERTQAARRSEAVLVLLDIPLLFEGARAGTGTAARMGFAITVLVWVPPRVQLERTVSRDGFTQDEAQRRIRAQMPIDEKRAMADHVIDNSGTLEATRKQVAELFRVLSPAT
jgi:dephospho-CoA kinase